MKNRSSWGTLWMVVCGLVAMEAQATNLIVNGSFEADSPTDGATPPAGWTLTGYRIVATGGYPEPDTTDGTNSAVFDNGTGSDTPPSGTHSAKISQTVTTVPGTLYVLSFDRGVFGTVTQKLRVEATGAATLVNQVISGVAPNYSNTIWNGYAYAFTADSSSTTIAFSDATDNGEVAQADLLLDNVVLDTLTRSNGVINGSFEADHAGGDGATAPAGWTLTGYRFAVHSSYPPLAATDGNNAGAFDDGLASYTPPSGTHSARIAQAVSTRPGQFYALTFDCGIFGNADQKLRAEMVGAASAASNLFVRGALGNWTQTVWTAGSCGFTADSGSTTIAFADATDNGEVGVADLLLDNVAFVETQRVINVDFNVTDSGSSGTYAGTGAAPDVGTFWNGWAAGARWNGDYGAPFYDATVSNLVNSYGGEVSTIALTVAPFRLYDVGPGFDNQPAAKAPALMSDFVLGTSVAATVTFTLSGLRSDAVYDLYCYAQNGGYASAVTLFTVGGETRGVTNTVNASAFIEGENYVRFPAVRPDGADTISGSVVSGIPTSNFIAWNGLQLVEHVLPRGTVIVIH